MSMFAFVTCCLLCLCHAIPTSKEAKCGYDSCNPVKDDMINVHLVPHTHDDVGWLKTVDQYYYGARNEIQNAGVQYVLDSVIPALVSDPNKRFIYVEIAFFARWWREQTDSMRHVVKGLVNSGWCMNDEASTHYNAMIDQHALGFEFLRQNFGECGRPRIGWQIDPFGHSREQASMFAQFGFDGLFFGRLDYQDKNHRLNTSTMEMLWHGSPDNLGEALQDKPYRDDNGLRLPIPECPPLVQEPRQAYQIHQHAVNLLYSTPSCYTYQLNRANKTWPTKSDDFFPYADREHTFWTGYFTSRAALKGYVRETNAFSQACRQLDAMAKLTDSDNSTINIQVLKEAMGVAQHHDAVSGTEKQQVAYDYALRLANGRNECQKVMNDAMRKLLPKEKEGPAAMEMKYCDLLNISACTLTEQNKEMVPLTKRTTVIPERKGHIATSELVFQVQIPALGFSTYMVKMTQGKKKLTKSSNIRGFVGEPFVMKNKFDGKGNWEKLTDLHSKKSINVTNDIVYYNGMPGNCSKGEFQPSGAYIFRPNETSWVKSRDYRETWDLNQTEPVAGNYYPDEGTGMQFTVMTDRSQGGASIHDGEVELMVHRRLLYDDCKGVGEPMNETGADQQGLIIRGKMYLHLGQTLDTAKFHRDFGLKKYMAPIPAFSETNMKYQEYSATYNTQWSGLKRELPANVHLLTLEQWGGPTLTPSATQPYLIRLEHFYEMAEDAKLSLPVTVSLQDLFATFTIDSIEELTLGANLAKASMQRLKWNTMDGELITDKDKNVYKVENRQKLEGPLDITLNPMEIRTFQVNLKDGPPRQKVDRFTVFSAIIQCYDYINI
ncbi:MAuncharacterized [Mya arenaria]|uniref:Alpha-mannosidase n=1 Tax=Mya arenaria TaxID=6604 RepID=A0ABY7FUC1_MYAAR|nr:MAuncharacterized [Mya arenaria]